MSSRDEVTLPATRPKSRKSLAHVPSSRTMDQENMTTDFGSLASGKRGVPIEKAARKSRSKSIGPGGLDALKDTAGNRRKSLAIVPHPPTRSILKPTMPPLREIPAHKSARNGGTKNTTPPIGFEGNLIDFDIGPKAGATVTGGDTLPNPFNTQGSTPLTESRVMLRTEGEQQAAAREREEKERKELEKEVISRRDARRKSLANRRVSFAPEATLHTWDVVVEYQDSTTSSSGTRRASSASGAPAESPKATTPSTSSSDPVEPPSTPPEQVEQDTVTATPEHQRDLHRTKRRRSSVIPPMNFNNPDDDFMSSSPFSGDSAGDDQDIVEDNVSNGNSDSGDDDDDGTTMMSLDGGDTADMSMASLNSASSTVSNRLDAALQEAARLAGTQGVDFDEHGAQESEDDELVASFTPWSKKNTAEGLESRGDQENVNPFVQNPEPILAPKDQESDGEEMTMDMTSAMGGILPNQLLIEESEGEDMTMEMTSAIGGILSNQQPIEEADGGDMTMDMTSAIGGILSNQQQIEVADSEEMTMDMTSAIGGILPNQQPAEEDELSMDVTRAFGNIIPSVAPKPAATRRKSVAPSRRQSTRRKSEDTSMGDETMEFTMAVGAIHEPAKIPHQKEEDKEDMTMELTKIMGGVLPQRKPFNVGAANAILGKRLAELDRDDSADEDQGGVKRLKGLQGSPVKNVRLQAPPSKAETTGRVTRARKSLDNKDDEPSTPSLRIAPTIERDLVGTPAIDGEGLEDEFTMDMTRAFGTIISNPAPKFTTPSRKPEAGASNIQITPPTKEVAVSMQEVPRESSDDKLSRTPGAIRATTLSPAPKHTTPRRKPGRSTPKMESAPTIENVPISVPKINGESLEDSCRKQIRVFGTIIPNPTPKLTTKRKFEASPSKLRIAPPSPEEASNDEPEIDEVTVEDDRMQLQDFLNMTSIRFMELTTTKRRHTIAPRSSAKDFVNDTPASLEDCVAAGAATIPMLELFQHACAELKKYISEGRKTVREIETETFEENPPLFREYLSATPDMKIFIDGQLKNVKTHARLLSKSTWYDWRMTLLGTVKEGLIRSAEGMIQDEEKLDEQQALIETVLSQLIHQAEELQQEESDYQLAAEELANCDPEELGNARQRLITVDADIIAKKQLIADLQKQLQGKEAEIDAGIKRKQVCLEDIREAEKVREECRGWTSTEISVLKGKVDAIERSHGWTITGVSGSTTSMTYQKEIELVFDASSFNSKSSKVKQPLNSRIDLWYIGANRQLNPLLLTPEREFFLQSIRDHIRGLPQSQTPLKDLLSAVSSSWNKATSVVDNLRLLNISCPTEITKTSDSSILVRSSLMITPLATKVEISVSLASTSREGGIDVKIQPSATVSYGERFNEPKMGEFLLNRLGGLVEEKGKSSTASWGDVVAELGEKLLARGRK